MYGEISLTPETNHCAVDNFSREEKEKLNVWVALMNLENLYGSQETLVKVFDAALKENEPIEVFFRLVTIYEQSKKLDVSCH